MSKVHQRTLNFRNSFYTKVSKIHPNLDFTISDVIDSKIKIKYICKHHGIQEASPTELLLGKGCKKCGYLRVGNKLSLKNKENILKKFQKLHQNKYEYLNLDNYKNNRTLLEIKCPVHGNFKQRAQAHLAGQGCKKCADLERNAGWAYTKWEESAKLSKYFDSYKLYILKCWDEEETFYKIGKTFRTIKERFGCKRWLPYSYSILKIIEGSARYICELEYTLKKDNKKYLYFPRKKFRGQTECFKKVIT